MESNATRVALELPLRPKTSHSHQEQDEHEVTVTLTFGLWPPKSYPFNQSNLTQSDK